jgi:hypothetical protein
LFLGIGDNDRAVRLHLPHMARAPACFWPA